MKKFFSTLVIIALFFPQAFLIAESETPDNSIKTESSDAYVDNQLLIIFASSTTEVNENKGIEEIDSIPEQNISVVAITDDSSVEQKIAELRTDPSIKAVQPNFQYETFGISTDDTYKNLLWGLDNTGQSVNGTSGINNADINGPEAWVQSEATTATGSSTIVAIIDTGVAYNHPDLAASMWDGSACKDENGVLINGGCNHGYDFDDGDATPLPTTSNHGTHIAGIIAAVRNNTKGIAGVTSHVKIMAIKSSLTTANIIQSLNFAKQNGAKIVNASWGGNVNDLSLKAAIDGFGGLFITAAGNANTNHEVSHTYPCDFASSNIVCVAATTQSDSLASFSDYGSTTVALGAPGVNIYSTVSDSVILNETFNEVTPPALPVNWVQNGSSTNWGTYHQSYGNVLFGDLATPYANNASTTVTSDTVSLDQATTSGATMSFSAVCQTEYTTTDWRDFMQLEYSADGTTFVPAIDPYIGGNFRWDQAYLDELNGTTQASSSSFTFSNVPIPAGYLTNSFKFRFHWVTNGSNNNYTGCSVRNITVTKFSDGSDERYSYLNGTSMATPHVVGVAAMIEAYNSDLTPSQIKNILLTSGDTKSALVNKTISGKRLNAESALQAAITLTNSLSLDQGAVGADSNALVDVVIQGTNIDLQHITGPLTNPLPAVGTTSSSTISWSSGNPSLISNDGQTINRPTFEQGDATTTLIAIISKGNASTSKIFNLIVTKLDQVITPRPSSGGGGGGGGGSSGGSSSTPSPVTAQVSTTTNIIDMKLPKVVSTSTQYILFNTLNKSFTKNLSIGKRDAQVLVLQQYLNAAGYTVALSGAGSIGLESLYFGQATKAALIKFQKDRGIIPASGYFGPLTRAYINLH